MDKYRVCVLNKRINIKKKLNGKTFQSFGKEVFLQVSEGSVVVQGYNMYKGKCTEFGCLQGIFDKKKADKIIKKLKKYIAEKDIELRVETPIIPDEKAFDPFAGRFRMVIEL